MEDAKPVSAPASAASAALGVKIETRAREHSNGAVTSLTLQLPLNNEFLQYSIWAKLLQALELACLYPTVTSNFPTEYCTENTHSVRC